MKLKEPHHERDCWSIEELALIIESARQQEGDYYGIPQSKWWVALLCVMYDTGLRMAATLKLPSTALNGAPRCSGGDGARGSHDAVCLPLHLWLLAEGVPQDHHPGRTARRSEGSVPLNPTRHRGPPDARLATIDAARRPPRNHTGKPPRPGCRHRHPRSGVTRRRTAHATAPSPPRGITPGRSPGTVTPRRTPYNRRTTFPAKRR